MRWSPKQMKLLNLHQIPQSVIVSSGAIRSGKTEATCAGFVLWSGRFFEPGTFLVAARSQTQLWGNVGKKIRRHCEAMGVHYKERRQQKHIEVGANKFYMFDGGDRNAADKTVGFDFNGALLDDAVLLNKDFVDEVMDRCSETGAKAVLTCNPKGPSHWLKTDYIDRPVEADCFHQSFGLYDNPELDRFYIEQRIRVNTGHRRLRNIMGLWAAAVGLVYPDVTYIEGMPDGFQPNHWDISVDFANDSVSHALLIAQDAYRSHVVDEWVYDRKYTASMAASQQARAICEHFRARLGDIKVRRVYVDPSAISMRTELEVIYGNRVRKAINGKKDGEGIDTTNHMLECGQLTINPQCHRLKKELESYEWDPVSQERGEAAPIKRNDHGADALRYWCYTHMRTRPKTRKTKRRVYRNPYDTTGEIVYD